MSAQEIFEIPFAPTLVNALEPYRKDLGQIPDGQIARLANVSKAKVREYRIWLDIEPFDRWREQRERQGRAPLARKPARSPALERISKFRDLVGQVPDQVVAERAGVHRMSVRNYRRVHGIPGFSRNEKPAPMPIPMTRKVTAVRVWMVHFDGEDEPVAVVARTLVDAIDRVPAARRHEVRGVELGGRVL